MLDVRSTSYDSMSRRVLLAIIMMAAGEAAGAQTSQWTLLPTSPVGIGSGERHEDMVFPTPERGYVVNFAGELHRTTDGGETWQLLQSVAMPSGERVHFRSAGFATEDKGWIGSLSEGYVLWQTGDGGETLTNITPRLGTQDALGICGLWVVNENVVYGVGRYYGPTRLYMTKNGGLTWTVKDMSQYAGRLIDVFFFDEMNGMAVGGSERIASLSHAVVLRTRDGGASWETAFVSEHAGEWGWKITFPTPEVGYVSVERLRGVARVLKTTDGGDTWTEAAIPDSGPLQGIGFITKWQGWTGGRGTPFRTLDGGVTWQEDDTELDPAVNRFRFFGDTLGYAVGTRVYKYVGKTDVQSETVEVPASARLIGQNYPNPFYPSTTFEYEVLQPSYVEIGVYDLLGRAVKLLVARRQTAGAYRAMWDGTDETGDRAAPGVYLYSLRVGGTVESRKMVLVDTRR